MTHKNRSITLTIFLSLLAAPFSQVWADDDDLTANELARALHVQWATFILPGSDDDSYMIGPILEFGDETKPVHGGMMGIIQGGSKVKILIQKIDGFYKCSILSANHSSSSKLKIPFEDSDNAMWIGGTRQFNKNTYVLKVAKGLASISSNTPLKLSLIHI